MRLEAHRCRGELSMYKHILVATDGSKLSKKAVTHAISLAKALGARLTAFYASPDYPLPIYADGVVYEPFSRKEYAARCEKEAAKILAAGAAEAKLAGVALASAHAISASPWEAILAAARKHKCDAIVMASHGRRGISALLLGSETQKVLTHSKVPVIVVR
jgi:nucleotide-binding universal stress UspA family protein